MLQPSAIKSHGSLWLLLYIVSSQVRVECCGSFPLKALRHDTSAAAEELP
jgi:hypothetical protein